MEFSPQQERALPPSRAWARAAVDGLTSQQIWKMSGFAGTGKSTLTRYIVEGLEGVIYCAPTAKAALVMRQKGCPEAMTIHKALYQVNQKGTSYLESLLEKLRKAEDSDDQREMAVLQELIRREEEILRELSFSPRDDAPAAEARLIVVDEGSMVGAKIGRDLERLGVPILVQYDPGQLQPVKDTAYFTGGTPDVFLTEIHRQAADSGILRLATDIRNGLGYRLGEYGPDCRVVKTGDPSNRELALAADQVIVGRNETRFNMNFTLRTARGRVGQYPIVGDRLICLRNDYRLGVVNGGQWLVENAGRRDGTFVHDLRLHSPDGEGDVTATVHQKIFEGHMPDQISAAIIGKAALYDFADAITAHKSQGSEWPRVFGLDESARFGWEWLYTLCTRASKDLTLRAA